MKHALQCKMQYSALPRALILVDTYSAFSVVFFNCLCGLVVKSVDFESKGPQFDSRSFWTFSIHQYIQTTTFAQIKISILFVDGTLKTVKC